MSQPLDRACTLPQLGDVDRLAGEFWVGNAFEIPNSGENLSAYERNCLFLNLGGLEFIDASFAAGADIDADSRSAVSTDFDRDGAPDLLVGSVGGGPLRLFANHFPTKNNRITVRLKGEASNRAGLGSRLEIHVGERKIIRDIFANSGFMGQEPAELSIGVGRAKKIDKIQVRWPSGKLSGFPNIPVNSSLLLPEGNETLSISSFGEKLP